MPSLGRITDLCAEHAGGLVVEATPVRNAIEVFVLSAVSPLNSNKFNVPRLPQLSTPTIGVF